tara:strand:- start:1314 stop:2510 length:1197 start_codon:yes stop_codon:yes gene_type:complete
MIGKLKFFISLLVNFKSLYSFAWQRILIMSKLFLRFEPPYEYEKKLVFDKNTESILGEIDKALEKKHCGHNHKYKAKWDSVYQRAETGNFIASSINKILPLGRNELSPTCLENLNCEGYSSIPEKNLSKNQVEEVLRYLETKVSFPSHVAHRSLKKPCSKDILKNGVNPFASYDIQTILGSRVLAGLVGDQPIINLVGNYFGCVPTLCNVNLYWSLLRLHSESAGPQSYHRDVDDHKIVNVFVNLTETAENDGAYCHIDKTQNIERISEVFDKNKSAAIPDKWNPFGRTLTPEDLFVLPLKGYGFGQLYDYLFEKHVHQVFGPAGTVRCADGYGLHRAIPPASRDRLLFWLTFSLTRSSTGTAQVPHQKRTPYSKVNEQIVSNDLTRYVLRNVIDFNN